MFNTLLVDPITNILVLLYSITPFHDFGIAVILLTIFIRLVLWPLQSQQLHNQKKLNKIQPEVKKIQEKYKNDPMKMNQMVTELYKEKEVNPFSSCLPSLLQLPIMIALFYAINKFGNPEYINLTDHAKGLSEALYSWANNLDFVKNTLANGFSTDFLGIVDLAKPSPAIAILAGMVQFVQTKMMMPKKQDKNDPTQQTMNIMLYMFPAMAVAIGWRFAAALPLYWIVNSLMAVLQQYLIMHHDIEVLEENK